MLLDKFKLDGKVAVVTGAGKGIGRGIALGFAEAGAHVVCAARTQADIDDTAREAAERGPEALAVACDVTDTESLRNLAKRALEAFGRVDVLVNNAGGTGPRPALKTSEAFFEAALRFNATSAFLLSQRLAPMMVETAGGGAIVNISSRCADLAQGAFVAYGAGKAALNMMTRNMAIEFAPKVRVNAIGVGGIDTDSLKVVLTDEALAKEFLDNTPMGRAGTPEDVAACALYLASPASSWVTGKVFDVDGGTESVSIRVPTPPL